MNLKKLGLITLLASASLLSACSGCSNTNNDSSGNSGDIPEGYVRVFYYVDFNQPDSGEVYYTHDYELGSKIDKPETPSVPDPAYPVFLGWSYKEVIDNKDDLWNFDTDTLTMPYGGNMFNIYGIWVAAGES